MVLTLVFLVLQQGPAQSVSEHVEDPIGIPAARNIGLLSRSTLRPACPTLEPESPHRLLSHSPLLNSDSVSLQLELLKVVPLPEGRSITGVASGPGDAFVAWHQVSGWVGVHDDISGRWIDIGAGRVQQPVAAAIVGREVQVVGVDGTRWSLEATGRVTTEVQMDLDLEMVSSAAFGGGSWFVSGRRSSDGRLAVFEVSHDSSAAILSTLSETQGVEGDARLTAGNGSVAVTQIDAPFATVGRTADVAFRLSPASAQFDTLASRGWLAMGALHVDEGWIQVLFDPSSDNRLTLTFDCKGKVIGSSLMDVALGLVGYGAMPHSLLGLRDTGSGGLNVLVYRWRWKREKQAP